MDKSGKSPYNFFMYDLTAFSLKDMTTCGVALRQIGMGATCMEEVADKTVRYLYDNLGDETGEPTSLLVRFFVTYPFHEMKDDLQKHVQKVLGRLPEDRN